MNFAGSLNFAGSQPRRCDIFLPMARVGIAGAGALFYSTLSASMLVLSISVMGLSVTEKASAQNGTDAEAKALFQAGRFAFEDGRYEEALKNFERAYELSKRPQLLYNVGTAADRLRQNEKALKAFKEYLKKVPKSPNRREVEGRIRFLEKEVADDKNAEARLRAEREKAAAEADAKARAESDAKLAAEAKRREDAERRAAQAAAATVAASQNNQPAQPAKAEEKSYWWVWLIVGAVVVAGGAVTAAILLGNQGEQGFRGDPDVGFFTLTRR